MNSDNSIKKRLLDSESSEELGDSSNNGEDEVLITPEQKESVNKAKFDLLFFKRFSRIYFRILGVFTPMQLLCSLLIMLFAIGNAFFTYFYTQKFGEVVELLADMNYQKCWENIFYLGLSSIGRFICGIMIYEGWITYFLYWDWRKRLTNYMLERYFHNKNYYVILNLKDNKIDNPDQRIQSDVNDFTLNLAQTLVGSIYFVSSAVFNLIFISMTEMYWIYLPILVIPVVTFLGFTFLFSEVSKTIFKKDSIEGNFRFSHARIREHCESMAFFKSEELEMQRVEGIFKNLIKTLKVYAFKFFFLNTYNQFVFWVPSGINILTIVIYVLTNTYPFDGHLSSAKEGSLVSTCNMFASTVIENLGNFFKYSTNLAVVIGNTARIGQMIEAIDLIDKQESVIQKQQKTDPKFPFSTQGQEIIFDNVQIDTPAGKTLFKELNFSLRKGKSLIIMGPSGSGKSSILRILCGLWNPAKGDVIMRDVKNLFFLPQNPYLTKGSLKENILFPKYLSKGENIDEVVTDEKLKKVMQLANIEYLVERYSVSSDNIDWDQEISLGEMQRVAMARLFFHKPEWAILDECTSALDPKSEGIVYSNAKKLGITFISVAHRKSVMKFHELILQVDTSEKGSTFQFKTVKKSDYEIENIDWELIDSHLEPKKKFEDKDKIFESESDLEKNDKNLGKTGVNFTFLKRFISLFTKRIIVVSCQNWFLVILLIIVSLFFACTPLANVLLTPALLRLTMDRKLVISIIYSVILLVSFVVFSILSGITMYLASLQGIMMRKNMTDNIHKKYFKDRIFYKINQIDRTIDNADQRICTDIDLLTSGFETVFGLPYMEYLSLTSLFQGVLFTVVAFLTAGIPTAVFSILMIVVVSIIQMGFMQVISKLRFIQQKREGYLRFSLTRMKVYSEQIAFYNGAYIEKKKIQEKLNSVLKNQFLFFAIRSVSFNIVLFYTYVSALIGVLAMMVSVYLNFIDLSKYHASEVLEIIQTNMGMIGNITYSVYPLLLVIMNFSDTVGLVGRFSEMKEKIKEIESWEDFKENRKEGRIIKCKKVDVFTPGNGGKKLISDLSFKVDEGNSMIIQGPSGCGKSSLLRTIGGLWDVRNGKITTPSFIGQGGIFFLPQKVYLVLGTLKQQIIYPDKESKLRDEELLEILEKVNLEYIYKRMGKNWNTVKEWGTILSPGEQQRVSFARLLYHQPRFAFLDESTSSLDEENEKICYNVCKKEGISLVSVGHRETVVPFHDNLLVLDKERNWKLFHKKEK